MRVGEQLPVFGRPSRRHSDFLERGRRFPGVAPPRPMRQRRVRRSRLAPRRGVHAVRRQQRAQARPFHIGRDARRHPFIIARRRIRAAGGAAVGMRVARARRLSARPRVRRDMLPNLADRPLVQREVDELSFAREPPVAQRYRNRRHPVQRRHQVGEGERGRSRRTARVAHHARQAGHRLHRWTERRIVPIRARRAEPGHRTHHNVGTRPSQVFIGKPEVSHDARSEILHDEIGRRRQFQKNLAPFFLV